VVVMESLSRMLYAECVYAPRFVARLFSGNQG
jgi:hypothetical protein